MGGLCKSLELPLKVKLTNKEMCIINYKAEINREIRNEIGYFEFVYCKDIHHEILKKFNYDSNEEFGFQRIHVNPDQIVIAKFSGKDKYFKFYADKITLLPGKISARKK
jgi:ferredoxin-fold anticodon binding domain-containing protein